MATAFTSKRRAIVGACMAMVQLGGAMTAGVSFARDNDLLFSASAAFTAVVMIANRWYFQGWRESYQVRRSKTPPPASSP